MGTSDDCDLLNQEQERLKGAIEMADSICHEINQPLQAIVGYVQLLQMDIEATNVDDELLRKIQSLMKEIDRISGITRKLATINKYKTKRYVGNQTIIDIDESCK